MGCTSVKMLGHYDVGKETVNNIKKVLCHGGLEDIELSNVEDIVRNSLTSVLQNYRLTKYALTRNENIHLSLFLAIKFVNLLFVNQWTFEERFRLNFYEIYDSGIEYSLPEHQITVILGNDTDYTRRLMYEKNLDTVSELKRYLENKVELFLWKQQIAFWMYNVFR